MADLQIPLESLLKWHDDLSESGAAVITTSTRRGIAHVTIIETEGWASVVTVAERGMAAALLVAYLRWGAYERQRAAA